MLVDHIHFQYKTMMKFQLNKNLLRSIFFILAVVFLPSCASKNLYMNVAYIKENPANHPVIITNAYMIESGIFTNEKKTSLSMEWGSTLLTEIAFLKQSTLSGWGFFSQFDNPLRLRIYTLKPGRYTLLSLSFADGARGLSLTPSWGPEFEAKLGDVLYLGHFFVDLRPGTWKRNIIQVDFDWARDSHLISNEYPELVKKARPLNLLP